jgi:hypothetical protein
MRFQELRKEEFERSFGLEIFWIYDDPTLDHPIIDEDDQFNHGVSDQYKDRCNESFYRTQ